VPVGLGEAEDGEALRTVRIPLPLTGFKILGLIHDVGPHRLR
jgi:hypothetical protein